MNEEILINVTPQETRVALVQQGAVQELHVERTLSRGRVGNIYLGKVVRVLPGMQSAFIDIGLERAAFLHVADIWQPRIAGDAHQPVHHLPIEKTVFEGQTLMVQVIRHGLIPANRRRLICLSMFWHFLDVVWIGVFTFVYLMGVLK